MEHKVGRKKLTVQQRREIGVKGLAFYEEEIKDPTKYKPYYSDKRKKWIDPKSQVGYLGVTIRNMFSDMANEANDSKDSKCCYKLVSSCIEKAEMFSDIEKLRRGCLMEKHQVKSYVYQVEEGRLRWGQLEGN